MGPSGVGVRAHHPNLRRPEWKNHDKQVAKMDSAPQKKGGGVPWGPKGPKCGLGTWGARKRPFRPIGRWHFLGPILGRFWIFSLWGLLATSQRLKIREHHTRGVPQALPTPQAPETWFFKVSVFFLEVEKLFACFFAFLPFWSPGPMAVSLPFPCCFRVWISFLGPNAGFVFIFWGRTPPSGFFRAKF